MVSELSPISAELVCANFITAEISMFIRFFLCGYMLFGMYFFLANGGLLIKKFPHLLQLRDRVLRSIERRVDKFLIAISLSVFIVPICKALELSGGVLLTYLFMAAGYFLLPFSGLHVLRVAHVGTGGVLKDAVAFFKRPCPIQISNVTRLRGAVNTPLSVGEAVGVSSAGLSVTYVG